MPERRSYEHGTPSWVDLSTTDPEGAQLFYGALFGWEFETQPTDQGGDYVTALNRSRSTAGIMQQPQVQAELKMPPVWLSYVTINDIDSTISQAVDTGGQILMPATDVLDAGKMAVIADPTGSALAVWEPGSRIGAEVVNEHGALIWNELLNSDISSAMDFYSPLFGWTVSESELPIGPYMLCNVGENTVAGGMTSPSPQIPNHWAVYFAVDDIDTSITTATDNGGSILNGPMDIGIGKIAAMKDPQGASFHLMQPADSPS